MKQFLALVIGLAGLGLPAFAQKKPSPKASAAQKVATETTASVLRGKPIYVQYCQSCHHADGGGTAGLKPPLSKTAYLLNDRSRLILVLLMGKWSKSPDGEANQQVMPSQKQLTDQQIADVLTYARNSFGNKASAIKALEVKDMRRVVYLKSMHYDHSAADTTNPWNAP